MAKYPLAGGGHSSFLQKRLNKNQKYFDSGDYQMAKQTTLTGPNKMLPQSTYNTGFVATGDEIPTPETVPMRKTSIIQSKFHPPSMSLPLS
ncbi:unnamed protein product [Nesidiocoris tenuis]|uniref:Alpha-endosulfine n=1 Tax=Nesidiocoris tenuis TaxID=355587 RepID=A0A6H5HLD9_9HEMI|nr:unnamed protein product [Nesidiocoris tenuis]CAB0017503.1 unnamed protein product [Nesidiocoris tenuis]